MLPFLDHQGMFEQYYLLPRTPSPVAGEEGDGEQGRRRAVVGGLAFFFITLGGNCRSFFLYIVFGV